MTIATIGGAPGSTLAAPDALKALASEIDGRASRIHEAVDEAFVLANDGTLRWLGEAVGKEIQHLSLEAAFEAILAPQHLQLALQNAGAQRAVGRFDAANQSSR